MAKTEEGALRWLDIADLMVLLVNLHLAAQDEDIGHGHASRSLRDLTVALTRDRNGKTKRTFQINKDVLESCLWSCHMMSEKKKFWSPYITKTVDFNGLLKNVLEPDEKYDKFYCAITKKEKNGKSRTNS